MTNLIPIVPERTDPVFVGETVRITVKDKTMLERYKIACSDCKQFLSGVIKVEGDFVAALMTNVRLVNSHNGPYVVGTAVARVKITEFVRGKNIFSVDLGTYEEYPYEEYVLHDGIVEMVEWINSCKADLLEDKDLAKQFEDVPDMPSADVHGWINRYGRRFVVNNDYDELYLITNTEERLRKMTDVIRACQMYNEEANKFHEQVEDEMREAQKEYYLREELKVINGELYGDADDIAELEDLIEDCHAPEEVLDKLRGELRKMVNMAPASPESFVARNWIETVASMPWGVTTTDNLSIENARTILENDHYGLEKVKQRILEFLSIHKMVGNKNGNILCLYGPPGVGKTSVAKSIAHALGREYVRISLGGMHDEAEIRGHRRTYIGSMAGKIIMGIKKAGTVNPVFLMDEVDKLSNDYKGDPASALLEVLDPEQNKAFYDNYLEVPFDLSKVLFITTANNIGEIAKPLLDRMEMIELTGYTFEEKEQIALRHLLPKQIREHGMEEGTVRLTDGALRLLIDGYTREAGVRGLEQQIASLCRKVAVSFGDKAIEPVTLDEKDVRAHLGMARYEHRAYERQDAVGCVVGLAWTELGGETMDLEAVLMPNKGGLRLTGNLGKVMRESATTAYSYVKSHAEALGIAPEKFERELHIHAPEGAVPKDGPSAGCALVCLIVSALTDRKLRSDRALTGEVSLTGRVMAIGGLKEKSLGALRDGITTILVPEANRPDVEELPKTIRDKVTYIYNTRIEGVLQEMFA